MFVDGVDSLHVPRHHLDTGFLRAVSREKLMVRLQVEHAGSFPWIYRRALVQMPRDPISAIRSTNRERNNKVALLLDEKRRSSRIRRFRTAPNALVEILFQLRDVKFKHDSRLEIANSIEYI